MKIPGMSLVHARCRCRTPGAKSAQSKLGVGYTVNAGSLDPGVIFYKTLQGPGGQGAHTPYPLQGPGGAGGRGPGPWQGQGGLVCSHPAQKPCRGRGPRGRSGADLFWVLWF